MKLCQFLEQSSSCRKSLLSRVPDHPYHEIAKKQMADFGGMVTFTFKSGLKADAINSKKTLKSSL